MTKDEIRDVAILVTEHLLDQSPELLSEGQAKLQVNGEYTQYTFDLQDSIEDALAQIIKQ